MVKTFTCQACGETMEEDPEWSDEQAWAEAVRRSGPQIVMEETVIICDDCFADFLPWAKAQGYIAADYDPELPQ